MRDLEAADIAVLKVQPLGGVRACLRIAEDIGLPVVVSSAVESSVGIAAGVALAAALPELHHACGLATVQLLTDDVVAEPLLPVDGMLPVGATRGRRGRAGPAGAPPTTGSPTGARRLASRRAGSTVVTPLDRARPHRRDRAARRAASREVVLAPGLAQRAAVLRAVRRRAGGRPAPAHPDRRAHGRLPRARARQGRRAPRGRGLHVRHGRRQPAARRGGGRARRRPAGGGHRRPAGAAARHRRQPDHRPGRHLRRPSRRRSTSRPPTSTSCSPSSAGTTGTGGRCTSTSSSTTRCCPTTRGTAGERADVGGPRPAPVRDDRRPRSPARARSWSPATTPVRPPACSPRTAGWPLLAEPSSGCRTGDARDPHLPAPARRRPRRRGSSASWSSATRPCPARSRLLAPRRRRGRLGAPPRHLGASARSPVAREVDARARRGSPDDAARGSRRGATADRVRRPPARPAPRRRARPHAARGGGRRQPGAAARRAAVRRRLQPDPRPRPDGRPLRGRRAPQGDRQPRPGRHRRHHQLGDRRRARPARGPPARSR